VFWCRQNLSWKADNGKSVEFIDETQIVIRQDRKVKATAYGQKCVIMAAAQTLDSFLPVKFIDETQIVIRQDRKVKATAYGQKCVIMAAAQTLDSFFAS